MSVTVPASKPSPGSILKVEYPLSRVLFLPVKIKFIGWRRGPVVEVNNGSLACSQAG